MDNKVEVEGSPERAADRGRAEDLGFEPVEKPSLGNPDVVAGLVAEFAGAVVDVRRRYHEDKLTGDQAKSAILDLAKEYGAIVMGRDERFAAQPWHNPARLGRRIRLVMAGAEGGGDPGEQLFETIGASLSELAVAMEAERISDAEAERQSKEMLADVVQLILGTR